MSRSRTESEERGAPSNESAGAGVRVAILDSGFNPTFPLIKKSLSKQQSKAFICEETAQGFTAREVDPAENSDSSGHGSCVHSCTLAVAPAVYVGHYRILDEFNNCSSRLLCLALDHILEQDYHIINLSLGTRNETLVPWLVSIVKRAYEKNVSIVAASSNIGNALFPGRFTYCISVAGAAGLGRDEIQYRPKSVIEFAGFGVNVPVPVAPKRTIRVTGSSYASGHVTGLCARAISEQGGIAALDPIRLKMLLREQSKSA